MCLYFDVFVQTVSNLNTFFYDPHPLAKLHLPKCVSAVHDEMILCDTVNSPCVLMVKCIHGHNYHVIIAGMVFR